MQEEDGANTALVIFTLPMMCRSILSSLTEACTLQVHAWEMLIDNDGRHLLTKPVGITFFEMHVLSEPSGVANNQKSKKI